MGICESELWERKNELFTYEYTAAFVLSFLFHLSLLYCHYCSVMHVTAMPASAYMALAFVFGFIQINWWWWWWWTVVLTWFSTAASYNAVVALRRTSQWIVVSFDAMLFAECYFGQEHDSNRIVRAPGWPHCTHPYITCMRANTHTWLLLINNPFHQNALTPMQFILLRVGYLYCTFCAAFWRNKW